LDEWQSAGFEGYESTNHGASQPEAEVARKRAEKHGLRIHSVMFGWANFNKPASVEGDIKAVETSLKAARAYGASTVLLVPCRIAGKMPQPWEFDIRFDEKSGHLKQVVAGDNAPYADYMALHNASSDASREAVKRLIPAAEKQGIIIALENVWNNMWVVPEFHKNLVEYFDSPWVRAYYDIGNHVKYCPAKNPPEQWIRTLGKLIVKMHVKDYKLNAKAQGGDWANIRDGSVNWPAVRAALEEIDYNSWMSIEGGSCTPAEHGRRFDLILAGK
jgi:hexulose-6-phosphate isomerase